MVNGGSPPLTVVDRWSGGGPGDGRSRVVWRWYTVVRHALDDVVSRLTTLTGGPAALALGDGTRLTGHCGTNSTGTDVCHRGHSNIERVQYKGSRARRFSIESYRSCSCHLLCDLELCAFDIIEHEKHVCILVLSTRGGWLEQDTATYFNIKFGVRCQRERVSSSWTEMGHVSVERNSNNSLGKGSYLRKADFNFWISLGGVPPVLVGYRIVIPNLTPMTSESIEVWLSASINASGLGVIISLQLNGSEGEIPTLVVTYFLTLECDVFVYSAERGLERRQDTRLLTGTSLVVVGQRTVGRSRSVSMDSIINVSLEDCVENHRERKVLILRASGGVSILAIVEKSPKCKPVVSDCCGHNILSWSRNVGDAIVTSQSHSVCSEVQNIDNYHDHLGSLQSPTSSHQYQENVVLSLAKPSLFSSLFCYSVLMAVRRYWILLLFNRFGFTAFPLYNGRNILAIKHCILVCCIPDALQFSLVLKITVPLQTLIQFELIFKGLVLDSNYDGILVELSRKKCNGFALLAILSARISFDFI
ncbi:hypothetical protein Tco_0416908 [Tanacetum coccineum]